MSVISVKQRMLRNAATVASAEGVRSPERAMRLAVRRAAEKAHGWMMGVIGVGIEEVDLDELLPLIGDGLLLGGVERAGLSGLIAIDGETRSALIELQICGVLSPKTSGARGMTAPDFAFAGTFLTGVLNEVNASSEATEIEGWAKGAALGDWIRTTAHAETRLKPGTYRLARVTLDLAAGGRQGELILALHLPEEAGTAPEQSEGFASRLMDRVKQTQTRIEAVLHRIPSTSLKIEAFQVGNVIALDGASLGSVSVEVAGKEVVICNARLGQVGGMKAIRIEPRRDEALGEMRIEPPQTKKPPQRVAFDPSPEVDVSSAPNR